MSLRISDTGKSIKLNARALDQTICDDLTSRTIAIGPIDHTVATQALIPTMLDLFCGAGGVTTGSIAVGFKVLAGVDNDTISLKTYEKNHPDVSPFEEDLAELAPEVLLEDLALQPGELTVLTACAPCQTFSTLARSVDPDDPRNNLVNRVVDFVATFLPTVVVMENVPRLEKDDRFASVLNQLKDLKYGTWHGLVDAADFGVPQRRKRLILIGVRGVSDAAVPRLRPDHPALSALQRTRSVKEAFQPLTDLSESEDLLHRKRDKYPELVANRIAAIPPDGGSRTDLPKELQLTCHRKLGRKSAATSAYGRMRWSDPAPTLTTRCTTPSCGRFLHPEENREITLREAACLQTFPIDYRFSGGKMAIQAQIGNAVPPRLAEAIGLVLRYEIGQHWGYYEPRQPDA